MPLAVTVSGTMDHPTLVGLTERLDALEAENRRLRQEVQAKDAVCEALTSCVHDFKNVLVEVGEAARLQYGNQPAGQRYDQALISRILELYRRAHPERRTTDL